MSKRTCSVDECERPVRSRNMCGRHYDRVRRYGSPYLPGPRKCSIDGCDRPHSARGWCRAHYKRWQNYGDPLLTVPVRRVPTAEDRLDIETRILEKCVTTPTACIEWTGNALESGYGAISWQGRAWVVHRAMWTATVGPIPTDDDWTLDHLCFNKRCVNVKHLEVVTRTENARRGGGLPRAHSVNKARNNIACRNGHARTSENTAVDPRGYRSCLDCRRAIWQRKAERVNAERRAAYAERRAQGMDWERARLAAPSPLRVA